MKLDEMADMAVERGGWSLFLYHFSMFSAHLCQLWWYLQREAVQKLVYLIKDNWENGEEKVRNFPFC